MNVLTACEESGEVREAFSVRGHVAISCDLLPSAIPGHHLQHNIRRVLSRSWWYPWDLMIAFPPCTDLAVSGARYFVAKRADGRQQRAVEFVRWLWEQDIPGIVIENPVGVLSTLWRKPDQIIQPWQFGHPESKATCLWLKGVPLLKPTNVLICDRSLNGRPRWDNQTPSGQNKLGPSPERARMRGRTYSGIAAAMAEQWGGVA